jgi:glutamate synthase (NADPH/NADH) large chain
MSGGVVFLHHDAARGLDDGGLRERFAKGAKVTLRVPDDGDGATLRELLGLYTAALRESGQADAAGAVEALLEDPTTHFRVVRPGAEVVEQTISTE